MEVKIKFARFLLKGNHLMLSLTIRCYKKKKSLTIRCYLL
jgi:hypothetical protein